MLWGIQNQLQFYFASTFGLTSPQHDVYRKLPNHKKKKLVESRRDGGKGFALPNISQGEYTYTKAKPECQLLIFPFLTLYVGTP
jgi:hypothetical protein